MIHARAYLSEAGSTVQWLIERWQPEGQVPTVWLKPRCGRDEHWTTEAREAAMFSTREEAEQHIAEHLTASEHGFMSPSMLPRFRVTVDSTVKTPWTYREENIRRADAGRRVAVRFARKHYGSRVDRDDISMVVSDLIADLLHYAHRDGYLDPAVLLERVGRSFEGDFEDELR